MAHNELLAGLRRQRDAVGADIQETGRQVNDAGRLMTAALPTSVAMDETVRSAKGYNGGFRNFGDFISTVRCKTRPEGMDPDRLVYHQKALSQWENLYAHYKTNSPLGMNESFNASDGGYLIPPEFTANILMRLYANDILSRCTIFPIAGKTMHIPAINETSRADGSRFGGVTAYWRREASSVTATKPSLTEIVLDLDSLMLFIRATEELLTDTGGALEVLLTTVAAQELAFKVGDSIINGDGVGKPLGIMRSAAKITAAAVSGQGANTLVSTNIFEMYRRVHPSCRPTMIWLYDQSIETQLFSMTIGTAGAQLAAFQPPGMMSAAPYGSILGKPAIPVEFCQTLGTEGDIIAWDPTSYIVATKGGVATAVSMHLYFDTNEMAFRFTTRMDGKPWWMNPLTPKNAGSTQSCIVTLSSTRT